MSYQIITDSCCDFPNGTYAGLKLVKVPLSVEFRGQVYDDKNDDSLKEMYDGLRAGESAKTSAINPDRWARAMEGVLAAGEDVLVMAFSSGLSTTYQSAVIAAEELREKYPDRKIFVVDTLSASMGEGLLVWYACRKRDEGMPLEELYAWAEDAKLHLCHWFTVDDLMYLKRGGRISAATAVVGTMLQIKPVLHMDDEGHLIKVSQARSRKGALKALVDKYTELALEPDSGTVFISHGDCMDDVDRLKEMLKARHGVDVELVTYVGPVIGAHSGPGTLALFFLGKER